MFNNKFKRLTQAILGVLLAFSMSVTIFPLRAEETTQIDDRKLQNGSFENAPEFTQNYLQPAQNLVPYWNTTAYEGKLELFKKNTGVYITVNGTRVTLSPTDGLLAAELNADEESTLYQNVKTTPSTIYEWGLDHGARNGADTMALVIGPKQEHDPSKPNKEGRDQFMQMIDWLIEKGYTSVKTEAGLGEILTVYSKKFGESGTFLDNAGNNAFSMIPSSIYSEEWKIWIISDTRAGEGETNNPWGKYGSNAEGSASSGDENTGFIIDENKYYLYKVPAGQTDTVFGFVSVGYVNSVLTDPKKAKTYGNFLDNINFELYHQLSGSSTNHGSGVVTDSSGNTSSEGEETYGYEITVDNKLTSYLKDGDSLKIQAVVKQQDIADCDFIGVYYTIQNSEGLPISTLIPIYNNIAESTGNEDEDKLLGKWIKTTNDNGDILYTYYLEGIKSAVDLHFVFIKSPVVTYDSNGGLPYVVERTYNTEESPDTYSFKPLISADDEGNQTYQYIAPYISHAAEGKNDGWKFMGWLLTGDTLTDIPDFLHPTNADQLGKMILPAEHTVACNYSISSSTSSTAAQFFKIMNGNIPLTETPFNNTALNEKGGVTWETDDDTAQLLYGNVHKGLTMVAQWRWRQAFVPQLVSRGNVINSTEGGHVVIENVSETDENYDSSYTENGGLAYYASTNESVSAKAIAEEGCTFLGWFDKDGNLLSINPVYSYIEEKESVKEVYARFSNTVTQTYIRQIYDGTEWINIFDDSIGTIDRYEYTDAVGKPVSATAEPGENYTFVGWFDSEGNSVSESIVNNKTIAYITEGNATYYARYERTYTLNFVSQTKQSNNTFKSDEVGGKVSIKTKVDVDGSVTTSIASPNPDYKFLGWYDSSGNLLSSDPSYSATHSEATDGQTAYARFELEVKNITFQKTDEEGNPLGGATFRIELIESENNSKEAITMVGNGLDLNIEESGTSLKLYPGEYRVTEAIPPTGYLITSEVLEFKIDDSPTKNLSVFSSMSEWSLSDTTFILNNKLDIYYKLQVNKVDGSDNSPLDNVEFTLFKEADENDFDQVSIYTDENTCVSAVRLETKLTSITDEKASVVFENLEEGTTYYLMETKTRPGYNILPYAMRVSGSKGDVLEMTIKNSRMETPPTGTNISSGTTFLIMVIVSMLFLSCFRISKKHQNL